MSETISVHNIFCPGFSLEFSCIELVIHCGLVHAKIRSSDKDLPVLNANHRNVVELREREKKIIKTIVAMQCLRKFLRKEMT